MQQNYTNLLSQHMTSDCFYYGFYTFLRVVILKLFCTDVKMKTKAILWSFAVNPGKLSEILKQYHVISWLTYESMILSDEHLDVG